MKKLIWKLEKTLLNNDDKVEISYYVNYKQMGKDLNILPANLKAIAYNLRSNIISCNGQFYRIKIIKVKIDDLDKQIYAKLFKQQMDQEEEERKIMENYKKEIQKIKGEVLEKKKKLKNSLKESNNINNDNINNNDDDNKKKIRWTKNKLSNIK